MTWSTVQRSCCPIQIEDRLYCETLLNKIIKNILTTVPMYFIPLAQIHMSMNTTGWSNIVLVPYLVKAPAWLAKVVGSIPAKIWFSPRVATVFCYDTVMGMWGFNRFYFHSVISLSFILLVEGSDSDLPPSLSLGIIIVIDDIRCLQKLYFTLFQRQECSTLYSAEQESQ